MRYHIQTSLAKLIFICRLTTRATEPNSSHWDNKRSQVIKNQMLLYQPTLSEEKKEEKKTEREKNKEKAINTDLEC